MVVVRNLYKRGNVWIVRVAIPADLQAAWGKASEKVSLKTTSQAEALSLSAPIIANIKAKIAALRAGALPSAEALKGQTERLTLTTLQGRIEAWERAEIDEAYLAHFNGEREALTPNQAYERSSLIGLLDTAGERREPQPWTLVDGFDDHLAEALGVPVSHPGVSLVRGEFGQAWARVLTFTDKFENRNYGEWEVGKPTVPAKPASPAQPSQAVAVALPSLKLTTLIDRFLTAKAPPEAADIREVWKRLVEWLGDVDAASVTTTQAEDWVLAVKRFPKTRKPEIRAMKMPEIIALNAPEVLSPISVWKWCGHTSRVFAYAAAMKLIPSNPLEAVGVKKPSDTEKQRRAYKPEEIASLFSKPLFTGFSGYSLTGYRKQPGTQVVKDAKYWIPILALYHGGRLEELGGAKVSEVVEKEDFSYFDWTERKLKTPESARALPIHPKMKELGFLDYVKERREAGDEYLFPELPHGRAKASTAQFTKWWGKWMDVNGFPSSDLDFHAFRHTFKRACRGQMDEELHDLITGHKGQGGVGRSYGGGADVKVLAEALAKVQFPTFPI